MNKCIWMGIVLAAGLLSNSATAGAYTSCDGKDNMDFGDAGVNSKGNSYGVACHRMDNWQGLGDSDDWDNRLGDSTYRTGDASDSWTKDSKNDSVGHDDASDDGVTWRTSSDDGKTWTEYSSDNKVTQGDKVEFKFKFSRSLDGNHKFDELKAWIDWDQENGWDNTQGNDEVITKNMLWDNPQGSDKVIDGIRWNKDYDADDTQIALASNCNSSSINWNTSIGRCNSSEDYREYTQVVDVPLDAALGTTWLRARVVCESSLSRYSTDMVMMPHGYLTQGEVEDYLITVLAKPQEPPTPIPEPSSLMLMTPALALLAIRRRKRKQLLK